MSKFFTVLSHTFLTNIKSKGFIISTIVIAVLVAVIFSLPTIISLFDREDESKKIGVISQLDDVVYNALVESAKNNNNTSLEFVSITEEAVAIEQVEKGELQGFLVVGQQENGLFEVTYKAMNVNPSSLYGQLEQMLSQIQFYHIANALEIGAGEASLLFQPVHMDRIPLSETAKTEEELALSTGLVYILLFAIYMAVLMFGNMTAMEIAKEKTSRVMEILVSSVNPVAQMYGKIVGIALLGIVQFAFLIGIAFTIMKLGEQEINLGSMVIDLSAIPVSMLVWASIFFLLGYLLFATIAAMLASLVSRLEELNQIILPLTLAVVAAFMIAMFGLSEPEAPFIIITSYIPIFTPMIMFLRIGLSDPALWEIVLSVGLLVLTILFMAWFASKVYRGGVLLYGKSANIKDIGKALRIQKDA